MTHQRNILSNYHKFSKPQKVRIGDGRTVEALGVGNCKLEMTFKVSNSKHVTMQSALHIPKLASNLFSVGAATEKGNIAQFGVNRCYIRGKSGQLHGMGTRKDDGPYQLDCKTSVIENDSVASNSSMNGLDIWHQRLGHVSVSQLQKLVRSGNVSEIKFQKSDDCNWYTVMPVVLCKLHLLEVASTLLHLLMITQDAAECIS
ncbi:uncharacterized protein LOC143233189 [Tachypleus tridentatus]|uniref:uncharacterized protein LOC143233189 n=1 Tax=Tachypleus tridentatus TaxID=6853 RepID=UPI003FD63A46